MVSGYGVLPAARPGVQFQQESSSISSICQRIKRFFEAGKSLRMLEQVNLETSYIDRRYAMLEQCASVGQRLAQSVEQPSGTGGVDGPGPRSQVAGDGVQPAAFDLADGEQESTREARLTLNLHAGVVTSLCRAGVRSEGRLTCGGGD
jgi:hypothetical protein